MSEIDQIIEALVSSPTTLWGSLSAHDIDDLKAQLARNTTISSYLIRGFHCTTKAALFNELSAALQFPYYFGSKWTSLEDSLSDMGWQPHSHLVLLVADSGAVLEDEPVHVKDILEILLQHVTSQPPGGVAMSILFNDAPDRLDPLRSAADALVSQDGS